MIGWSGGSAGDILLFSSRPPRDFASCLGPLSTAMMPIGFYDNYILAQSSTVIESLRHSLLHHPIVRHVHVKANGKSDG